MSETNEIFKKILEDNGFTFPSNESQVEKFESLLSDGLESPNSWPDINELLESKSQQSELSFNNLNSDDKTERFMSMAARDGKKISDDVKKQMKEDKDKANGK